MKQSPHDAPLAGLVVVDVTIARSGPTAVRMLADLGADVIRVEPPGGDEGFTGSPIGPDYLNLHRNKRSIALNLKDSRAKDALYRLVKTADVFVENFRPPVKYKLGIDYERLAELNRRLIYGSISGFGQDGPYADKGAVDQIIQGMSGMMSVTGHPGGGPVRAGIAVADLAAGHQLAIGLLAALHERERSGRGQWVQVSLLESAISFLDFQAARWTVDNDEAEQAGNGHPTVTPMGTFAVSDGYVNIAASSDRLWARLCAALAAPALLDRPEYAAIALRHQHREQLNAEIQSLIGAMTRAQVIDLLEAAGVPCGPVYSIPEVFEDPQVVHLGIAAPVQHAVRGNISVLRQSVGFSRTPPIPISAARLPGQDTDEVLAELGFSATDIDELHASGAV